MLANLYMLRFVLDWKTLGHERKLQSRIVNYADDFVVCCSAASEAMHAMRNMMAKRPGLIGPQVRPRNLP